MTPRVTGGVGDKSTDIVPVSTSFTTSDAISLSGFSCACSTSSTDLVTLGSEVPSLPWVSPTAVL